MTMEHVHKESEIERAEAPADSTESPNSFMATPLTTDNLPG